MEMLGIMCLEIWLILTRYWDLAGIHTPWRYALAVLVISLGQARIGFGKLYPAIRVSVPFLTYWEITESPIRG